MTRNKLTDLNNHLFIALERLNEEDLTSEQIELESKRAESIIGIAGQIIGNAKITVDAMKLISNGTLSFGELPESFGIKKVN